MISVVVTCLATPGQQWRASVQSSVLNARINPGSPAFAAAVRHLQEALTSAGCPLQAVRIATARVAQLLIETFPIPTSLAHFTVAVVIGTLGAFVIALPACFSMNLLLNRGQS